MFFELVAQAERKTKTSKKTKVFLKHENTVAIGYRPHRVKEQKTASRHLANDSGLKSVQECSGLPEIHSMGQDHIPHGTHQIGRC